MLEFLDAKTIFVLSGVFSALMAIVFYAIHRGVVNLISGVTSFAWAFSCYTVFAFLLLCRSDLPPFIGIVLADTFFCLALLFIVHGFHQLKGLAFNPVWFCVYPLLCLFAFCWFSFVIPSFTSRVFVSIVCIVSMFSWMLWHLLREPLRELKLGGAVLTLSLLVSVISALARLVMDLNLVTDDATMSILAYHGVQAQYLIVQLLTTIFIAVGLMIMTQDILRDDLENLASYDMLTGVLTRRVIVDILDKTLAQLVRNQKTMSVMMLDIDHFKAINDRYGHCVGDMVLKSLVCEVERVIRKDSYIGRYGGEEFLIVMPDTSEMELLYLSHRILSAVADTTIENGKDHIKCTVSIGAVSVTASDKVWMKNPIRYADEALYQAKAQGRNCVVQARYPLTQAIA